MNAIQQAKHQVCAAVAKAQYLAAAIILNTEGYASCRFEPEYLRIQMEFAPSKRDWDSRLHEVTHQYISEDCWLNTRAPVDNRRKFGVEDTLLQDLIRAAKRVRNYTGLLEEFLQSENFDMDNCKKLSWYTETIKYRIYEIEGDEE